MNSNTKKWRNLAPTIGMVFGLMAAATALVHGATIQRPIEDFVAAQGTFCFPNGSGGCLVFVPPVPNFFGFSNNVQDIPPQRSAEAKLCASVDYAGLANATVEALSGGAISFGTTTDGMVTERPLRDGRAEVTVKLYTKNALTWVIRGRDEDNSCGDFGTGFATQPVVFGHRWPEVFNGEDAALGDSFLQVVFINTEPGASLPDLEQLIFAPLPGQELRSISAFASASGTFRTAFGVEDGTPGRVHVVQIGLFKTPFKGATADGFPAEQINLNVIGQ